MYTFTIRIFVFPRRKWTIPRHGCFPVNSSEPPWLVREIRFGDVVRVTNNEILCCSVHHIDEIVWSVREHYARNFFCASRSTGWAGALTLCLSANGGQC
jgi:hypothetical protein